MMTPSDIPASVDIGSHSSLLLLARWQNERLEPKVQRVSVCRLGEDLRATGLIHADRLTELASILTRYRRDIHALGGDLRHVVLTEAVRKAQNQDEVLKVVRDALWIEPRVVSGDEEAALSYKAVSHWHGNGLVSIDVGGGSTDLSNGSKSLSIAVGALGMFKEMGAIPGPEYKAWIKATFAELDLKPFAKKPLVFVGGTAVALGMVHLGATNYDWQQLEGLEIDRAGLDRTIMRLSDLSKELRAAVPGLEHGRAEVVICGLYWIRSLVEKLKADSFRISTMGLRLGVLLP